MGSSSQVYILIIYNIILSINHVIANTSDNECASNFSCTKPNAKVSPSGHNYRNQVILNDVKIKSAHLSRVS